MSTGYDRVFLTARARHQCEYCHFPEEYLALGLQVDHVIARQHGGGDGEENLAMACVHCNGSKVPNIASIDPSSGQLVRLFNPRTDAWAEHFDVMIDRVRGKTPIGRATANVLDMNSEANRHLRWRLLRLGVDL